MNKYHAKRTWSELCQRFFSSKLETRRGEELCLLEKAGEIDRLIYQHIFILSLKPKVSITLDFSYHPRIHKDPITEGAGDKVRLYGERVYEDTKGVLTRDFRTKLAWLRQLHGIDVLLTK